MKRNVRGTKRRKVVRGGYRFRPRYDFIRKSIQIFNSSQKGLKNKENEVDTVRFGGRKNESA